MPRASLLLRASIAAFALLLAADGLRADDDQELARRLRKEGRIRPLAEIVEAVQAKAPGKVLEVEFEVERGVYIYEIKILAPDGRVREIEADAATGEILKIEADD